MAFKVGQDVVCIKKDQWHSLRDGLPAEGPAYKEVNAIAKISPEGFLSFAAYPKNSFAPQFFRPLDSTDLSDTFIEILIETLPLLELELVEVHQLKPLKNPQNVNIHKSKRCGQESL